MKTALICVAITIGLFVFVSISILLSPMPHPDGRVASAETCVATLEVALDSLKEDVGRYPSTQEGLQALRVKPTSGSEGWMGPYIARTVPPDLWGREYQYVSPGLHNTDSYDVWCFGPDRKDGTKDDITNWPEE